MVNWVPGWDILAGAIHLVADVLNHQHEGDDEAADAAHPGDEAKQAEHMDAVRARAECTGKVET
jgi:hypothetical protein